MLTIKEVTSVHAWTILLYQIEHAYSCDFALGVELAMASHLNPAHRLALRKGGFFDHPDVNRDIQIARGLEYGALLTEQMEAFQPEVYQELQRLFPWKEALRSMRVA